MKRKPRPRYRRYRMDGRYDAPDGSPRYLLDRIPAALWRAVRARAQSKRVSIRFAMLFLLEKWAAPRRAAVAVKRR